MRYSRLKVYKTAIGLMRPALGTVWDIVCLSTRSRTPANNSLAVVIHSFDGYKRFWQAARYFTERAIPSLFPIYYMTERIAMHSDPSKCILTGTGGFSTRLARGLDVLSKSYKYVFYLQEDIWLHDPLSVETLSDFVQQMEKYELDCFKLGWASFDVETHKLLFRGTERLTDADDLRWYGPYSYSMGHHCAIFRTSYLWRTAIFARLFRQERPLANELFVSEALKSRIKARSSDGKKIRIAVWESAPLVSYTHACARGRLTPEGQKLLEQHKLLHLYDETLPGETIPAMTSDMLQSAR